MYDSATPSPTGSLSGPWIDEGSGSSKNVTGKILAISNEYAMVKNVINCRIYISNYSTNKNSIFIVSCQVLDPCILTLNAQTVFRQLSFFICQLYILLHTNCIKTVKNLSSFI